MSKVQKLNKIKNFHGFKILKKLMFSSFFIFEKPLVVVFIFKKKLASFFSMGLSLVFQNFKIVALILAFFI